jgi:hypothetical protein
VPEHCADELALRRARRSAAPLRVRQRHKPVLVRYNTHAGPLQRARRARRAARPVHALKRASPALCRAGPGCAGRTRVSAVPVQMWQGWAQSRRGCGQPAASAVPVQMWQDRDTASKVVEPSAEAFLSAFSSCATLAAICARIEQNRPRRIQVRVARRLLPLAGASHARMVGVRTAPTWPAHSDVGSTNPTASTAWVAGIGPAPPPRLHRHWVHPSDIWTGIELAPATSAPGLGSPRPYLDRDWAHPVHIWTGTGLTPATPLTSALELESPRAHLHRKWAPAGLGLPRNDGPSARNAPAQERVLRQLGRSQPCTRARQPLCRRSRGEPDPSEDVKGVSPVPLRMRQG